MKIFRNQDYWDERIIITIVIFIGLLLGSTYLVFMHNHVFLYKENGPLENIQVVTLMLACLVFFTPVVSQKRMDKLILLFFAFLCLSFIVREIDVEKFDIPEILIVLGSGIGRNIILGTGFIAIFSYAFFNFSYYKHLSISFLRSKNGVSMITAGIFLGIGSAFEHAKLVQHHQFFEEMSELTGYVLILLVAWSILKNGIMSPSDT